MKQLAFFLVLIIVLGVGGFVYRNIVERPYETDTKACTLEAKLCPDGSAVGRTGPNCEFAPCPTPVATTTATSTASTTHQQ